MATILFEIWETDDSMECVPVSAQADAMREPDARFVKAFYASTPNEADRSITTTTTGVHTSRSKA